MAATKKPVAKKKSTTAKKAASVKRPLSTHESHGPHVILGVISLVLLSLAFLALVVTKYVYQ